MAEQTPSLNIFMICEQVNKSAYGEMPDGYKLRLCRHDELHIWKIIHFDDEQTAKKHLGYMDYYYDAVYAPKGNLFYEKCLFVVDVNDNPIATCLIWKAYGAISTVHWYKVKKKYEGKGIGRALLTVIMRNLSQSDYPVLLHTQPESNRAIKLYSDFGFKICTDDKIGSRENHVSDSLSVLKSSMPRQYFDNLQFATVPKDILSLLSARTIDEF